MIILYNPQNSPNKKAVLPMSLLAVGALLEGRHEYRIVDGNLEASGLEALDRHIGESGVTLLGMTVMPGPQLADALPVCHELRRRHPALRIRLGRVLHDDASEGRDRLGPRGLRDTRPQRSELSRAGRPSRTRRGRRTTAGARAAGRRRRGAPAQHAGLRARRRRVADFPYHRVDVARYLRKTFMGAKTISHHASYGCPFRSNPIELRLLNRVFPYQRPELSGF
jgi:hypothetical protein